MSHPIQCKCGCLKGSVADVKTANRVVCYCRDCQAFAHFLGNSGDILDRHGGTDIVQTLPKNISFTQGTEVLACMRLTETGLLRWYTTCCKTPIGNTLPSHKMSFVGLVHNCLESSEITLNDSFGSARIYVHTKYAKGESKPKSAGLMATVIRNLARVLRARIDGTYKQTPFFWVDSGVPIVSPKILSHQEYQDVMDVI
ncbi:MAG: hypothetical protein F6K00_25535 [Leptolyngbya sp. SIOISBB]|nr:hypothetical protein [Leptolyngbya sp. SIOISBB]